MENANIQVLTSDGDQVNFGVISIDCEDTRDLVLVNSGLSNVPLYLELNQPSHFFAFEDGSMDMAFNVPGVDRELPGTGQGVAKELKLSVATKGLSLTEPRIYRTELKILLGQNREGTLLGSVPLVVKVGVAKMAFRPGEDFLQFFSNDVGVTKNLVLRNTGNIPLHVECSIKSPDDGPGLFKCVKTKISIGPNTSSNYPVSLVSLSPSNSNASLEFQVVPNGPTHSATLQFFTAPGPRAGLSDASGKPGLSFGVLKKKTVVSPSPAPAPEVPMPTVFPVESDRSLVNFFCVGVGGWEQQEIALRNATADTIVMNLIIRDTDSFAFPGGENTLQMALEPHQTRQVTVGFFPKKMAKVHLGKLVLKPQGKKLGGKSFKASICLSGVSGDAEIVTDGVETDENGQFQMTFSDNLIKHSLVFSNTGSLTGFVKLVTEAATTNCLDISQTTFILPPGAKKVVNVTWIGDGDNIPLKVTIFKGSELLRQVMKKARKLPGGARLSDNSSLDGFNPTEEFPGEFNMENEFKGQVTAMDVKHFFRKSRKEVIAIRIPSIKQLEFDQLAIEETLSETRIDQSIALPLHTTNIFKSQETPRVATVSSPPTQDAPPPAIKIQPARVQLQAGGECLLRLTNLSASRVHWDMSWPSSRLGINPGSGEDKAHITLNSCIFSTFVFVHCTYISQSPMKLSIPALWFN